MMTKAKSKCVAKCEQVGGKRVCNMMRTDYSTGQCYPRTADEFESGSLFEKKSGKATITIGCPKGKYDSKTRRCSVGTRALKMTIDS